MSTTLYVVCGSSTLKIEVIGVKCRVAVLMYCGCSSDILSKLGNQRNPNLSVLPTDRSISLQRLEVLAQRRFCVSFSIEYTGTFRDILRFYAADRQVCLKSGRSSRFPHHLQFRFTTKSFRPQNNFHAARGDDQWEACLFEWLLAVSNLWSPPDQACDR